MTKIPNQFHFVFGLKEQIEEFHILYYLCLRSCIDVNKPERVFFYYHYEPHGPWWDLIKGELDLVEVELEDFVVNNLGYYAHHEGRFIQAMQLNYAHQADFIREEFDKQQITVVPQHFFFKHDFTAQGIETLFRGFDHDTEEVYSMHLWNHLWWDEKRTDFSTFHQAMLTEDYIREVDTTYNVIARQYLP